MHRFPEHLVNHLSIGGHWPLSKVPPGSIVIVSVRPEIYPLLRDDLSLAFPLLLVFIDPLVLVSIWSMSWRMLVTSFPVKDFHKPCLVGRPTLKELMAMSSTLPSISLYISQYLSEYVFRVSPSRMDKDSGESKGRGTLLQVIKREPNA